MRRGWLVVCAVLVVLTGAGCGASSEEYTIAGIDELTIPTPSPDPEDFVRRVDNPYLPLERGNEWTYDGPGTGTTTVTVEPSNLKLGGVPVTVVRTLVERAPADPEETVDYFAQDRDGNVWWFGRQGLWDVESAGAEAGLAMPADPRVGDGWRRGYLEGVVEDRLTVTRIEGDTVVLDQESDLDDGVVTELEYAAGFGLVRSLGPTGTSELSSGP